MVKLTYGKEVLAIILADYAKGASAEETQRHLQDTLHIKPCTNTIYAHRNEITIDQLIDELARQQERDITKEEDSDIRMHYRNELLKLFVPVKIIQLNKNLNINKTEFDVNGQFLNNFSEEDKIAVLDAYRRINKPRSRTTEPDSLH